MNMPHDYNPYQTPQSDLDQEYEVPPLYNANAAALWSILFTPFGAWIHAKNWEDIGEEELAKQNRYFAIAVVAWILIATLIEMIMGITLPSGGISFGLLIGWYFSLGKKQITLFKEELGTDYEKKSLVVPVLVGIFGMIIVLLIIMFIMQIGLDAMGLLHPNYIEE